MKMRRAVAFILSLLLTVLPVTPVLADTLSISAWSTGDSLSSVNLNSRMTSITTWSTKIANDNISSTAAIVGSKLDLTSSTGRISQSTSVTSDAPVFTSGQTWNNAAAVFSLWRGTVTNTNSASTSRLIDLRVGSTIIASVSRVGQLILAPQDYASGPTTLMEGAWFNVASATMTDNMTAASGTAPRFMAYAFQRPALAAANSSVTTTHAATVFIASAPVTSTNMTLTNRYALWVDQGDVRIGGTVFASGSATIDGRLSVGTGGTSDGQAYIKSAAAGTIGLVVDTAASPTAAAISLMQAGTRVVDMLGDGSGGYARHQVINAPAFDNGTGVGLRIQLNRNSNGTTPAAGSIVLVELDGGADRIWPDANGLLRIWPSGDPTNANDLSGTVVGDQTSWYEVKDILRQWDDPTKALEAVLATKIYDFRYKESSYLDVDNQPALFTGVVGFDRRDWFLKNTGREQNPSLNEINIHGFTILSIQALAARVKALEERSVSP